MYGVWLPRDHPGAFLVATNRSHIFIYKYQQPILPCQFSSCVLRSTMLLDFVRSLENILLLQAVEVVLFNNTFVPFQNRGIRFKFNNLPVEENDCYNYLGVIITNGNRFEKHIEYKRDKALRAIYSSWGLTGDFVGNQLPIHLVLKIFDTQIQPIVDYGCEIWYNGKSRARLETVHTTYIKRVLCVKPQTSNHLAIYGETGPFPFLTRQQKLVLRYWLKLDNVNSLELVYRELYELDNNGHETWCIFRFDRTQRRVGSHNIPPEFQNIEHLKSKMNTALEDKYIRGWTCQTSNQNEHPILRPYLNQTS